MTEEVQQAQLSIQDIVAAVQVIDISAKRGTFEGTELSQVGMLRDRLAVFLKSQQPAEEEAAAEEATEETTEE